MKVVLVAEAWGRSEARFMHPLVGSSGRELTQELGISGLAPYMILTCRKCKRQTAFKSAHCEHCQEHIWPDEFNLIDYWKHLKQDCGIAVTNVFNTQPPNNDLGFFFGFEPETEMPSWKASKKTGGSHLKSEHFHHIKRLWTELQNYKPNLIVALGNAACWAILGQTRITALRGTVAWSDRLGIKTLPTFHPAAVLRQMPMRVSVIADLTKAKREAEFPTIIRPERYITIPAPNSDGIEEIKSWLSKYKNVPKTVDIETIRGQISVVGFGASKSEALSIVLRDANQDKQRHIVDVGKIATALGFPSDNINFWPDSLLEFQAWKLFIQELEFSSEKTYQNGIYDMSYFLKKGIHPRRATNDTMLWHHSEYPELPKSLGYLGSIYANEVAWKTMSRHESLKRDE